MGLVLGKYKNDGGYKIQREEYIDGKRTVVWRCPYYSTWWGMIRRCSGKNLAYSDCSISEGWESFSNFKEWLERQAQHDLWFSQVDGKYQVDKDILYPGNRVYGEDFCVLVPNYINSIYSSLSKNTGDGNLPIGVSWKEKNNKYCSQISLGYNKKHLGLYDDPVAAHNAWLIEKTKQLNDIIDRYKLSTPNQLIVDRLNDTIIGMKSHIDNGTVFEL